MKRLVRPIVSLALLVVLAACAPALTPVGPATTAAPPITAPAPTPMLQPSELFLARPHGQAGPLLAYDMATGVVRFSLPSGLLSADGQHYLAAKTGADTQLFGYDVTTGAEAPLARLTGQWALSSLSASGRWAALTRIPSESEKQGWMAAGTWNTDVQIVDIEAGQMGQPIALNGNFTVDTLSPGGDALYVIQYLPAVKPDHYQVRLFDLSTGALQDGALVDKRDPEEVMVGQPWQAVAPRDGSWLFTLYLRTTNNTAFIHALNTENKYTLCFDLPTVNGSTLDQLRAYSLALSTNGQMLYATNPALGVIAQVDLNAFEVSRAASFTPDPASALINYSTADASRLFFTGGQQVWVFDTATQQVRRLSTLNTAISGLALGRGGRQLYVARAGQPPVVLDTTSGAAFSSQ